MSRGLRARVSIGAPIKYQERIGMIHPRLWKRAKDDQNDVHTAQLLKRNLRRPYTINISCDILTIFVVIFRRQNDASEYDESQKITVPIHVQYYRQNLSKRAFIRISQKILIVYGRIIHGCAINIKTFHNSRSLRQVKIVCLLVIY